MKNMLLVLLLGVSYTANSGITSIKPIQTVHPYFNFVPSFENIHLHKQGKGIKVQWSVSEAAAVTSFDIESTYEDPGDIYSNWSIKGHLPSDGRRMNMFSDMIAIYPGQVHYRIVAHTNNGDVVSQPIPLTIE
ncbi:MAG: hypothetical protein EOO13_04880 [Chitinophagaceae bacterium]|nr:MAG: hypothetical protein EOO13_04880 [Chitinophagaceae bacterium]